MDNLVLKLAGLRAINCPVTGVVDARRELVHYEFRPALEELNRDVSYVIQTFQQTARVVFGQSLQFVI